ncbi:MAG: hypothetical protein LW717_03855 [Chloroflexaceae bacterium]|nr:hypothetical protein [Chloroflexaceae bacterium]
MRAIDDWLIEHGNRVASELDRRADQICLSVSVQLERTYPGLCLDGDRADAVQFQKQMFEASPRRMHRLLQTALRLRAVEIIQRECKWMLDLAPQYGVTSHHMYAMARWYFEAARTLATIDSADRRALDMIEQLFLQTFDYKSLATRS